MKHKTKRFKAGGGTDLPDYDSPDFSGVSFKEAFAKARGGPNVKTPEYKTFMWNGTKYSTKLDDGKKASAKASGPDESAAETARLSRVSKAAPKTTAKISSEDVSPPAGTKLSYESSRAYPRESRSAVKGGGGSGGSRGIRIDPTLGAELDPKELMRRNRNPRDDDEARYADEGNPNFKRGGKVKKYAAGGSVTPTPAPASKKKDAMPEWAKNERENQKRDDLNKREAEGAAKEVKRNMSTFGFKNGGSVSSRADGCAVRGKTKGKIY